MQNNNTDIFYKNFNSNSPIGFFDSGVGGLSVYSYFKQKLPYENTIYFGDLLHLPYGNKSKEELIDYARFILNFYKSKNVKAVVIACNTSSAQVYETIKNEYKFKIFPIIQSCAKVIAEQNYKRIGVFATQSTVESKVYTKEIQKYAPHTIIKEIACPNWVNMVESNLQDSSDIELRVNEMLDFNPQKIILGCTHYPLLLKELGKYTNKNIYIDPAQIFVDYIYNNLKESNLLNLDSKTNHEEFYVSANIEQFRRNAKLFYSINSDINLIETYSISTPKQELIFT